MIFLLKYSWYRIWCSFQVCTMWNAHQKCSYQERYYSTIEYITFAVPFIPLPYLLYNWEFFLLILQMKKITYVKQFSPELRWLRNIKQGFLLHKCPLQTWKSGGARRILTSPIIVYKVRKTGTHPQRHLPILRNKIASCDFQNSH